MFNEKSTREVLLSVPSSALYFKVNNILSIASFEINAGTSWPTADLSNPRNTIKALAQIRPFSNHEMNTTSSSQIEIHRQRMLRQVIDMSDETCDVLDAIFHLWMKGASSPSDWVTVDVDQILRLRGLTRSTLKSASRSAVRRQIEILQNLWLTVFEMEIPEQVTTNSGKKRTVFKPWRGESRAFHVEARCGPIGPDGELAEQFYRIRPGEVLGKFIMGPGRQTALLSQKALYFDSANYWPEKRLCRFFAYQWRCRMAYKTFAGPFKIETILRSIHMPVDCRRPNRTKSRLEGAMKRLQENRVISSFRYEDFDQSMVGKKGWTARWLDSLVTIQPPKAIEEHYSQKRPEVTQASMEENKLTPPQRTSIGMKIRQTRRELGMNQSEVAVLLGITVTWLSLVESGKREPSSDLLLHMEEWIANAGAVK